MDTLQNYKMLSEMIPELDDLVETGIVTKTTILDIMNKKIEPMETTISKGSFIVVQMSFIYIWIIRSPKQIVNRAIKVVGDLGETKR